MFAVFNKKKNLNMLFENEIDLTFSLYVLFKL